MMIANRFILIGSVLCAGILLLCDAQSSTNRRFQNPSSEILVYDAERASWISVETNHSPTSQVAAQGVRPSSVVGPNISGNSQGSDRRNNPNEGFQNPSSEILVYDAERASWITVETNRSTTSQVAAQGVRPSSVVGPNKSGNSQGSNRWNNPNEGPKSPPQTSTILVYDAETGNWINVKVDRTRSPATAAQDEVRQSAAGQPQINSRKTPSGHGTPNKIKVYDNGQMRQVDVNTTRVSTDQFNQQRGSFGGSTSINQMPVWRQESSEQANENSEEAWVPVQKKRKFFG
ncbi:uncharacterized protein LOC129739247 isoform X1 [Uranotaenia lowii]|uniref:uncharacterized protein LOC129739247 isoform X1 n=1 Tax=Uranotaenia lowii TaxID=190385 RepID=UPI00247A03AB|nr:uncharacterized protein LOC129739247 isoform X1 [Uranotaenia lowii]